MTLGDGAGDPHQLKLIFGLHHRLFKYLKNCLDLSYGAKKNIALREIIFSTIFSMFICHYEATHSSWLLTDGTHDNEDTDEKPPDSISNDLRRLGSHLFCSQLFPAK